MVSNAPYAGSPFGGISRLLICPKRLVQTSFLSVVGKLLCFTLFVSVVLDIERCYYFIFRDVLFCVYHTRNLVLLDQSFLPPFCPFNPFRRQTR